MNKSDHMSTIKTNVTVRTASLFGVIASLGSLFLWVMFLFFNPYSNAGIGGVTYVIGFTMLGLSVVGILASLKTRVILMYIVFLGSLPLGLYFFLTPGIFKWLGLFCVLYLVSALLMTVDRVRHDSSSRAEP